MAFRLVVLDARATFSQASSFEFVGDPAPPCDLLHPAPMPQAGFAEVSFVDDIAYAMHSDSPSRLVSSLQLIASCLRDAAASRGPTVNYEAGKTEAIVRLAGVGSKCAKQKIWHQFGGRLPVVTERGVQKLQLVHAYKHLGIRAMQVLIKA